MDKIVIRGAREHNLRNIDVEIPRDSLTVITGLSGSGKSSPRVRHDLRRGAAALRRVAVGLRPAVPRADAEAGRRVDRGAVAGDLDRAEDDLEEPALHRRHRHRDLRLHAAAVGARRRAALARHRAADREPDGEPDGRPDARHAGGPPAAAAGAGRPRPQGRVQEGAGRPAEARLPAGQGGRRALRDRPGAGARQEAQARHRGGGRPAGGAAGDRRAAGREPGDGARAERRAGLRRGCRHRRADDVLGEVRLPGLRLHHRRDRAAAVLLQQPVRRLPGLRRPRHRDVLRPGAGGAGRPAVARGRRHRAVGQQHLAVLPADAAGAGRALRLRADDAVPRAAGDGPADAAVRLQGGCRLPLP